MLWYFKKSKFLYQSSIVSGFIFVCLLFSKQIVTVGKVETEKPLFPFSIVISNPDLNTAAGLVVLLTWILVFGFIATRMADRNFKQITHILTNDCDPECFIEALMKQFPVQQMPHKRLYQFIMLWLSTAMGESGRYEEMDNILHQINIPKGRRWLDYQYIYMSNLLVCHMKLDEMDNTNKMLEEIKSILDSEAFPKKNLSRYKEMYAIQSCISRMFQGDYTDAEQIMKERLLNAEDQMLKVTIQFYLGAVYLQRREIDNSREAFHYVIDHGNKLVVVAKARECLEKLEKMSADENSETEHNDS